VKGGDPSSILGRIQSNGKVFLINPKGIYFGKDSQDEVGSLIASTLNIQDHDFLQGQFEFDLGGATSSSLINHGNIKAVDDVVLLAPNIGNEGFIVAQTGKVAATSGKKVVLNFSQSGLVQFSVDGEMEEALISQNGTIEAPEGGIVLRMSAARKVVESVMNVDGVVEANELVEKNGVICLGKSSNIRSKNVEISGREESKIVLEGRIDASNERGKGGKVHVSGESIQLKGVTIDASGSLGGGEVLAGRGSCGSELPFNAEEVIVHSGSLILANALNRGDGGEVSISSGGNTYFGGRVEVRGKGSESKGGFVETSGKKSLGIDSGRVDASSSEGVPGKWLLDSGTIETKIWNYDVNPSVSPGIDPSVFSESSAQIILSAKQEGGSVIINDPVTTNHPGAGITVRVDKSSGKIILKSRVETEGGEVVFQGPVQVDGIETISVDSAGKASKGALIVFEERVEGGLKNSSLLLSAGEEGPVRFQKGVGEDKPLGGLSVTSGHSVDFSHDVTTAGGDVLLNAKVSLTGHAKIDTTAKGTKEKGANISILQGINGNSRLHLNAGTDGNIVMGKGAGTEGALSALHMKGKTINLTGDIRADGGTLTYSGDVFLGGNLTMEDTGPTGITFLGRVNGNFDLTLSAPMGKVSFLGAVGDATPLQNLTVASSEIRIKNAITVNTLFQMNGAVTLIGNSTIAASSILFEKTLDGPYNLSLNAGSSGSVILNHSAGGLVRLGNVNIINAQTVSSKQIYAKAITQTAGTGSSTFDGVLDTLGTGGIFLTGNQFVFTSGIHEINGGSFTLVNAGAAQFTGTGAISVSGGFSQTGAGSVSLSNNIVTEGRDILFTSAVNLGASVSLNTGTSGFGSVSFLSTVDGSSALTLTLGMGDLLFAQGIGQTVALSAVNIISARNVSVQNVNAGSFVQTAGFGIGSYSGSITTTSIAGISLTSNQVSFAGTGSGQVLTTSGSGNIVINALYTDIGSALNPVELNIASGTGTFFEGSSGTVFVAAASEIDKFCTVRSNPGCLVLFGAEDVTPNICCSHITPPPPPPPPPTPCPPCPPSSSSCHKHFGPIKHKIFEYIPGIYTNYWQQKDTLGAPWYFELDFIADYTICPWKANLYWGEVEPPAYRISDF